ncbi:MAG TPA: COX15/CtaA family protein [Vicinamibacterales bacterium]|nr:COX15/CtaA family protein [Vicinamibacterales bacterium]
MIRLRQTRAALAAPAGRPANPVAARKFRQLAWAALGATVVVIVWGAVVRATGSGAGCGSHWPLCNGEVVPVAPAAKTVIEFVHRISSGVAMLLSLGLMLAARRVFPSGHRARVWAAASFVFMLIEAAVGAGLVLLGLVENNASVWRAAYIAVHLTNTMLLAGSMTGMIWWAGRPVDETTSTSIARSRGLTSVLVAMIVVAATGAIVALGDTLFPATSLSQGLAADVDPASHFLIRLRAIHPIAAVAVALATMWVMRRDPAFTGARGESMRSLIVMLILTQAVLGAINLLMLAPLTLQMAHLLVSNILWIALVWAWVRGGQGSSSDAEQTVKKWRSKARIT